MKLLKELIREVPVVAQQGLAPTSIHAIQFDSRMVTQGDVFVAIKGTQVDGHQFILAAIEAGATVIVSENLPQGLPASVHTVQVEDSAKALAHMAAAYWDYPSRQLNLVGVTGTNGKTTVVTLLHQLFQRSGSLAGMLSTVVNKIGEKEVSSTHTTPDPMAINALLAEMVEQGCEYAFMEVSSHAISQRRVAGLSFAGGVFTNITHDHLDYHGTFKNYINTKKEFFDTLTADAFALTNIDDARGQVMIQNCAAKKRTYAVKRPADYKAQIIENSIHGLHLIVGQQEVFARMIGRFNAYNILATYAVADQLGMDAETIMPILSGLVGAPGRMQVIVEPTDRKVGVVDYAHTPDALENVLNTLQEVASKQQQIITIIGCGGDRDAKKRPIMGSLAANMSQTAIFTSDNPRSEDPEVIIEQMMAGVEKNNRKKVLTISDRRSAIKTAVRLAQPSDIILVAGKGHETYQIIKGKTLPFDDIKELKQAFGLDEDSSLLVEGKS